MTGWDLTPIAVGDLQTNAYLLAVPAVGEAALIDPGADPEELLRRVDACGCRVTRLICTHGHFDHVGAAADLQQEWGLPLLVHPADVPLIRQMPAHQALFGFRPTRVPRIDPCLADGLWLPFADGGLEVRHAPGHSPGHVLLRWDDQMLVGDLIFAGSVGRTDLPGGDSAALARSIRQRVYTLPGHTRLHPGHGPETTVAEEMAGNPFVRPEGA